MIKKLFFALLLFPMVVANAQKSNEQMPVFPSCEKMQGKELESCFY
ncbi:MAG: hypothetical protein RL108_1973, partial [Bacteroidota bacterium]